ncbi:MAG: glycosyltransferase family 39 protein [Planctomycetes bacterium]|nr:glycosyltransferase family 39 protein [Planctomycetota bacterium]
MQQSRTLVARLARPSCAALVFAASFGLLVLVQCRSGAHHSEFGAHPDEAAHVVTGLMVHDYLVGRDWSAPKRFAENYYLHYPKVGLGHWPPVFYVVQAGWAAAFGATACSLLLLMACTGAALATVLFRVICAHLNATRAAAMTAVFVLLPAVGTLGSMVMTEMLVALLSFAAALAFARYMGTESSNRWWWSLAFGVLASLAILTKGTGLLLALVPPLGLLLAGRPALFRRASLWLSAVVVATLCAPFYLYTLKMQQNGMQHESFELSFVPAAAQFYGAGLVSVSTGIVFLLALIGLVDRVVLPARRNARPEPVFAALAALLLGTWTFHVLVPCGLELRHLLPALPPVVVFAAAGLDRVLSRIGCRSGTASPAAEVVLGILVGLFVVVGETPYRKDWRGYGEVTRVLGGEGGGTNSVTLVSSDPQGEGMMVSEMALADAHRPSRYVLRASKVLASDRWSGRDYRTRFESSEAIRDYVRGCSVGALVIDTSVPPENTPEHHRQLVRMVAAFPGDWRLESSHNIVRNGVTYPGAILLYRPVNFTPAPPGDLGIDMQAMLGRKIGTTRQGE